MNYRVPLILSLLWLPVCAFANECTLLVLGDSLSAGYGLPAGQGWVDMLDVRLKAKAPQWHVINTSVSGDTTQNGLQRLAPALMRHRPQGVLIELGANDALRGISPTTIKQNLQELVHQAKKSGAWVVLLDVPVLPNYGNAYAIALARIFREVAEEEAIVLVPCFVCGVAAKADMMQGDGLHPNAKAQDSLLNVVWPYLKPKLRCSPA